MWNYNPKTKPTNPYVEKYGQFNQPWKQWEPFRMKPGNVHKNKRNMKVQYYNALAGAMGNPYTNTTESVNQQIATAKAGQVRGREQAAANMKQQAAKLGTKYSAMAPDAERESDEAFRQSLATQTNRLNQAATTGNRNDLLQLLGVSGNDIYHRKQLNLQRTGQALTLPTALAGAPPPMQGDSKVICSELHRQGLMADDIYRADEYFGDFLKRTNPIAVAGYHAWAIPCVSLMQKSKTLSKIALMIAMPWANQMAYMVGARKKPSFVGKIMLNLGIPLCEMIGKLKKNKQLVGV